MWRGSRCFIVGGGPSLKGFDWSALAGERVIAINRGAESILPAIWFSIDDRFGKWIYSGELGEELRHLWKNPSLPVQRVVCLEPGKTVDGPGILYVPRYQDRYKLSPSLSQGIGTGGNSGFSALNLALCLGADPIYLLGYDMTGDGNGRQAWFHAGYPVNQDNPYPKFLNAFQSEAKEAERRARIVNLNPDSGLKCFEFGRFKAVPKIQRPIVVSFHTPEYEGESRKLRASLIPLGLEHDIRPVQSWGSWVANCQQKPAFIRQMLDDHPEHPVLWLDSDAIVHSYPWRLDDLDADFACHWRRKDTGEELLSGTMFWGNTPGARRLLDLWEQANDHNPGTWDQRTLQAIAHDWEQAGGRMIRLPAEYCCIFDSMKQDCPSPVIEHFQASRRLKGSVT